MLKYYRYVLRKIRRKAMISNIPYGIKILLLALSGERMGDPTYASSKEEAEGIEKANRDISKIEKTLHNY